MIADVQRWLDSPGSSFGWALVGNETGNRTTKRFKSREHPGVGDRPLLRVTYTMPPA